MDQINKEEKSKWLCPECLSSTHKPVRNENTPTRRMIGLDNTLTDSSNVNKLRGSRLKTADVSKEKTAHEQEYVSEEELAFRLEVLSCLEQQTNAIKRIEEVCCNIKTEFEDLRKANMRVLEDKILTIESLQSQIKVLTSRNLQLENLINTSQESQVTGTSSLDKNEFPIIAKQVNNSVKNSTTHSDKIKKSGVATKSTKTAEQVCYDEVPRKKDLIDADSKNESTAEESGWTVVQRKKGKFQAKKVEKGQNSGISDLQAMERKKHLHVWRLHPETTVDMLTAHVKKVCGEVMVNWRAAKGVRLISDRLYHWDVVFYGQR
ncbi:hypothetical protein B5X24_HaOG214180 [Helicoverpa armigera]|nr:hypothetical protein B5X24_HaOG214180 [Helicoverpa armigera]